MKYVLILFIVCFPLQAKQKQSSIEYKCYLNTNIGFRIAYFEWHKEDVRTASKLLVANKVDLPNERKKVFIKEVIECVKMSREFSLAAAQILDEKTAK